MLCKWCCNIKSNSNSVRYTLDSLQHNHFCKMVFYSPWDHGVCATSNISTSLSSALTEDVIAYWMYYFEMLISANIECTSICGKTGCKNMSHDDDTEYYSQINFYNYHRYWNSDSFFAVLGYIIIKKHNQLVCFYCDLFKVDSIIWQNDCNTQLVRIGSCIHSCVHIHAYKYTHI